MRDERKGAAGMTVLMMTNTYKPIVGGLEKSIESFTEGLRKKGQRVVIVAPAFKKMPAKEKDVVRLPAIQNFNNTDFSINLPIPGSLSKVMKELKPDIIHAHHPFLIGDMALRLSGQYNIPLVFTYHTMFELYTHYLPVNNDAVRRFMIGLSAGYAGLADQVIAPSRGVKKILEQRGVKSPIEVIPTGVDLKRFRSGDGARWRRRLKIPAGSPVVGHSGRLAEEKNLLFLCEAVKKMLAKEKKARFILIGSGPLEEQLRHLLREYRDRVHFTGTLKGRDLVDAYHAMNVFVFASKTETQGLVVAEAMAAGVPVVALDARGVDDVIENGQNGYLLPTEDAESFASAVSWCLHMKMNEREDLARKARQSAGKISVDRCCERLIAVYEKVRERELESRRHRHHSHWEGLLGRLEAEWDLFKRLSKATTLAVTDSRLVEDRGLGSGSVRAARRKSGRRNR